MPEHASRNGWTRVAFGDVVQLSHARSADPAGDGYERYVGLEHIEPDDLMIHRWGRVTEGTTFTNVFRTGQTLFGKRRAYQRKVAVADFDGVCSGDIYVLAPKDTTLLPQLLPFLCQSEDFLVHAVGTSAGSLSPRTNWDSLAKYEFALPPLAEQRRIATELATALTYTRSLQTLAAQHASVRAAHREQILASQGFETISLGAVLASIVAGRSLAGGSTPPTQSQFGVLKVSAVNPKGFRPAEAKVLLEPGAFEVELSVRSGDLLMTRANTPERVADTCLVEADHPNLMLCDKTLRLEPAENVDGYLLSECLQGRSVRVQTTAAATGTGRAMKNISQPSIRSLSVRYPADRSVAEHASRALAHHRDVNRAIRDRVESGRSLLRGLPTWILREPADG